MNNTKENENDDDTKPYAYYEQQLVKRCHHYYISGGVEEPSKYIDMFHKLNTCQSNETVHIHLNTPGGILSTGVQLINAMQASQAHIICSIEAEASSLGTLIFLAADEWIVHDHSYMMFHNYSGMVFGKGHEQAAAVESAGKWIKNIAQTLFYPFLSNDEISRVLKGEDLYIHADDIRKRLAKVVKEIKKKEKENS